jgi:hypothetical protein
MERKGCAKGMSSANAAEFHRVQRECAQEKKTASAKAFLSLRLVVLGLFFDLAPIIAMLPKQVAGLVFNLELLAF